MSITEGAPARMKMLRREVAALPTYVRFNDLRDAGIVRNRPQLKRLIDRENFPTGTWLSPNVLAWTTDEIANWFETLAKAERSHANRYTKALEVLSD